MYNIGHIIAKSKMSTKEENEITVKVLCSKYELLSFLTNQGFEPGESFSLDDYYYIPSSLDIKNMTAREILSNAIILRYITGENGVTQKVTYKIKNIANDGDIISQKAISCDVKNIEDAKKLFEAIGYYEIMNIKEDDIVYCKDGFGLAIKFIKNSDILIEVEAKQGTEWDTIEKIKVIISKMNLPIEKGNYFVKKAENELEKIL